MRRVLICLSLIWLAATTPVQAQAAGQPWVMIDVAKQTLSILKGNHIEKIFRNISVGRNGYTLDHHEVDGKTPLGVFHVAWINPNSRFHMFFGLDYPNRQYAEAALSHNLIDYATYTAINQAIYHGDLPPQDTPLGGNIGIHGIGHGNRFIHETTNWTEGCVALTNKQIDQLARWITLGTKVVIY
ncbi:MAG: L,D-transpeptidase [Gammaproteobacteria bacterium]